MAIKHKAALVVYSLSRLSRSTTDSLSIAERLGKGGADLVSLSEHIDTTTPAGRMMMQMVGAFAEFERAQGGKARERLRAYREGRPHRAP